MPTATRALALRTGSSAAGSGASVFARLFQAGDPPAGFDVLLALAEPTDGGTPEDAERVLMAVRQCLAQSAAAPDAPPAEAVELLAAAHVWARGSGAHRGFTEAPVRLSMAGIRAGRYAIAQARSLPACLLRDDVLRPVAADYPLRPPMSHHPEDGLLEPELATGLLEDGDALLIGSYSLHDALGDGLARRHLTQSASPDTAAERLVEEALAHGAPTPAAAVAFVGLGPAVASRLRPLAEGSVAGASLPAYTAGSAVRRSSALTLAVALGGVALGVGLGVVITLQLTAPVPQPSMPVSPMVGLPAGVPAITPTPPPPLQPVPTTRPAPEPVERGDNRLLPVANSASMPAPSPPATPVAPAPAPPLSPAPDAPPAHTLADGMSSTARLVLRVDPARGLLLIQSSQGVLYGAGTRLGIPVGNALPVPLGVLGGQPADDLSQLRLYQDQRAAGALSTEDVRALLGGRTVTLGDLRAGDYDLRWWHPHGGAGEPLFRLRLAGW